MTLYRIPKRRATSRLEARQVYVMANGDLRLTANQRCWPAQEAMEKAIVAQEKTGEGGPISGG